MEQHLITPQGFEKLKQEWEDLKYVQRPAIVRQVQEAAAEGDRSENAAYTYGKMRLREIDRRLRYLDRLLDTAVIVNQSNATAPTAVGFGTRVRVRDHDGREFEYHFVGSAEINPSSGAISLKSPIGTALQGKKVGESVRVKTPSGERFLTILDISNA